MNEKNPASPECPITKIRKILKAKKEWISTFWGTPAGAF